MPALPAPPANRFGAKIQIRSAEDAEVALREIGYLAEVDRILSAHHEERLQRLNDELAASRVVDVDGESIGVAERRETLEAGVMDWATEHRDELCAGSQSLTLTGGCVKWRKNPDRVTYAADAKTSIAAAAKHEGLFAKLQPLVDALNLFGLVEVVLKINLTAAKKAFQKHQVTAAVLKSFGLKYVTGEETICVEPTKFVSD